MTFFVAVELHGNSQQFKDWCLERGIIGAIYYSPGWADIDLGLVKSHVRFLKIEDAVAYALTVGSSVSETIPKYNNSVFRSQNNKLSN